MIYAYYQGDNIDYWLSQSGLEFQRDLEYATWISRPRHQRLSLHEEVVSSPESIAHIHQLIQDSALCMIFVPELIDDSWFDQFDLKNVVFFISGFINVSQSDIETVQQFWHGAILKQLLKLPDFQEKYIKMLDPSWPKFDDLVDMNDPPPDIIEQICQTLNYYPRVEKWIAPGHQDNSVRDRWIKILKHPLFADFYQNIRDPSWPTLDELVVMEVPPEIVRQEILMSFQDPEEQDPDHQLDRVQDVLSVSGRLSGLQWAKSEFHYYFFWSTIDLYHRRPEILDLIKPYQNRQGFDVLLGRKKKHRDLVYDKIDRSSNIVTYFSQGDPDNILESTDFIWPNDVLDQPNRAVKDTTEEILVDGVIASVSQVIPTNIYNQTAYSLVCESQCDNGFSFFTEKIIKPMIARRIFVVVSGQHYLQNLRRLGFRTFDGVIDESYDQMLRMEDRVQAVLNLVDHMKKQDVHDLYQRVQNILDHNYDLIMKTDWQQIMCNVIKKHADNVFGDK